MISAKRLEVVTYSVKHEVVFPPPVSLRSACLPPLAWRKETNAVNEAMLFFEILLNEIYILKKSQIPSHRLSAFRCHRYQDIGELDRIN